MAGESLDIAKTWVTLKKWVTKYADIMILGAGLSAAMWCFVWLVGFGLLTFFSGQLGYPTETTALFISLTVLLGHLPKLVSMFFGTDTDFRDFKDRLSEHSLAKVPYKRLFLAGGLIWFLVAYVIPNHMTLLQEGIDPMSIGKFFKFTFKNWQICGMLFLIQAVFSYPKGEIKNVSRAGKMLPGAA